MFSFSNGILSNRQSLQKGGSILTNDTVNGLAFEPSSGKFYGSVNNNNSSVDGLYTLDPSTGSIALVSTVSGLYDLASCSTRPAAAQHRQEL